MVIPTNDPIFIVQTGNGLTTISRLTDGDLSSATLAQLYSGQQADIPAPVKLIEALIIKNLI